MPSTPTGDRPMYTLKEPTDLLALVPYLLGFHPDESLVAVVLRGRRVVFTARSDLPPAGIDGGEMREEIDYLGGIVVEQRGDTALLIGYGPADRVDALCLGLGEELRRRGLPVREALRAMGGRYWSLLCDREGCCPAEGTPYDITTSTVAATATLSGCVALPDRDALVRQIAPIGGLTRESMRRATDRATDRVSELVRDAPDEHAARAILTRAADRAIDEAVGRQAAGGRLSDDEAAWLSVLLYWMPIRDRAWRRVEADRHSLDTHRGLWADLMRRAEPDLVPAPGCLLAFTAWWQGNGALARIALDRVLSIEPRYSLARLLRQALDRGLPPSTIAGYPREATTRAPARRQRRHSSSRRVRSRPA